MKTLIAVIAVLTLGTDACGEMFKWVDKDGKTHYTDTPPPPDAKSATPPVTAPRPGADAKPAAAAKAGGAAERPPDAKAVGTQEASGPKRKSRCARCA